MGVPIISCNWVRRTGHVAHVSDTTSSQTKPFIGTGRMMADHVNNTGTVRIK